VLAAGERWAVRANEATVLGSVRSKKHKSRITGHLESVLSMAKEGDAQLATIAYCRKQLKEFVNHKPLSQHTGTTRARTGAD